jgi:Leucine-rich repeat (LRR) protein
MKKGFYTLFVGLLLFASCSKNSLEEALKKPTKITSLDLSYQNLGTLPETISKLENIENLNIAGNNLKTLPQGLFLLKKLKYLNLGFNLLQSLPPEIGELKQLESLVISSNLLVKLPKEIGQLQNLKNLEISWNNLTELPSELTQLKNLTNIELYDNMFDEDAEKKMFPNLKLEFAYSLKNELATYYFNTSLDLYKLKDTLRSLKYLTKSLELSPANIPALNNRATIWYYLKKYDKSCADLRQAYQLGDTSVVMKMKLVCPN